MAWPLLAQVVMAAVIGGLVAGITGGDVKKGVVYGAVGGLVSGVAQWGWSAYQSTTTTAGSQAASQGATSSATSAYDAADDIAMYNSGSDTGVTSLSGSEVSLGEGTFDSYDFGAYEKEGLWTSYERNPWVEGGLMIGGQVLQGISAAEMQEEQLDAAEKEAAKNREHEASMLAARLEQEGAMHEGDLGLRYAQLAEQTRQFDVNLAYETETRDIARQDIQQAKEDRKGALKGFKIAAAQNEVEDTAVETPELKKPQLEGPEVQYV